MNSVLLLLLVFFVLVVLKIPLAFALFLSTLVTFSSLDMSFMSLVNRMLTSVQSFPMLAIPFFLMAGLLMSAGGVTERLVKLSDAIVGHLPGGLAHVNVVVSMLFAGLSGSSVADTAGVGAIMIPAMKKAGYDAEYSAAITAASSTMGTIIPPSTTMIVYGGVAGVSIGAMFLGGVIPGILIGLTQMGVNVYMTKKHNYPRGERVPLRQKLDVFVRGIIPLGMPVLIIGGILGGLFTATEASSTAVVYGLVIMLLIYRTLTVSDLPRIFGETVIMFSKILFLVAGASAFGWTIAYLRVPDMIGSYITGITTSPVGITLLITLLLMIMGTMMSPVPAILITLPILQELGDLAGLHPIYLGVFVVTALSLGRITPPYGICMMIASDIAGIPAYKGFRAAGILVLAYILLLIVFILVPDIILFLPRFLMPQAML